MKKHNRGDIPVKQLTALLCVAALIVSCAVICVAAGETLLCGDANTDGALDMKDVLVLRLSIAEYPVTLDLDAADANEDNAVNTKDVLVLRRIIAELEPTKTRLVTRNTPVTTSFTTISHHPYFTTTAPYQNPKTEMRGVWLAYYEVAELMKSTPAETKAAIDELFDFYQSLGINTVFFHVRAYSDAYYSSTLFPKAKAVAPLLAAGFDPLTYAVEAAHKREMGLHAWLNPYRVGKTSQNAVCDHLITTDSDIYYNPASKTVRQALLAGIEEILKNYDVDGIHFDDYFYPPGTPADPQSFDWGYSGGDIGDFRREQVTLFVKDAYALTHKLKTHAVFGISPAGNLENDLNTLYADVKTWLKTPGCVDYLCPQLYFGFEHSASPFPESLRLWNELPRADGVRLTVGLAVYKAGLYSDDWAGAGAAEWAFGGDILARQLATLRSCDGVSGFALFSSRFLTGEGFSDTCDYAVAQKELDNLTKVLRND